MASNLVRRPATLPAMNPNVRKVYGVHCYLNLQHKCEFFTISQAWLVAMRCGVLSNAIFWSEITIAEPLTQ